MIYSEILQFIKAAELDIPAIPDERKTLLKNISSYISTKLQNGNSPQLIYICTHNSRRSHFGQIWAKVAATYYGIPTVETFSGGTEVTAFHPNAIKAIETIGFKVLRDDKETVNALYTLYFDEEGTNIKCFSKVYDDRRNPEKDFCAVMTCGDADEKCPFIPGAELRVATPYADPKAGDGTALQDQLYLERCKQIAAECLFVFSNVEKKL